MGNGKLPDGREGRGPWSEGPIDPKSPEGIDLAGRLGRRDAFPPGLLDGLTPSREHSEHPAKEQVAATICDSIPVDVDLSALNTPPSRVARFDATGNFPNNLWDKHADAAAPSINPGGGANSPSDTSGWRLGPDPALNTGDDDATLVRSTPLPGEPVSPPSKDRTAELRPSGVPRGSGWTVRLSEKPYQQTPPKAPQGEGSDSNEVVVHVDWGGGITTGEKPTINKFPFASPPTVATRGELNSLVSGLFTNRFPEIETVFRLDLEEKQKFNILEEITLFTLAQISRTLGIAKGRILDEEQYNNLINVLGGRFKANDWRHPGLSWETHVEPLLRNWYATNNPKLWGIYQMELSGGEIDLSYNNRRAAWGFQDFSTETPKGRRNIVRDQVSEDRLRYKIQNGIIRGIDTILLGNAETIAREIGMDILSALEYIDRQEYTMRLAPPDLRVGFDTNSHSWVVSNAPGATKHTIKPNVQMGSGAHFGTMVGHIRPVEAIISCAPSVRVAPIGVRGVIYESS